MATLLLLLAMQLLGVCAARAAETTAPFDLVIRGGRVIDPESGLDGVRDIGVRDGRIVLIAKRTLAGRKILETVGWTPTYSPNPHAPDQTDIRPRPLQ